MNLITIGMARKDHASIQQYSERLLTMRPFSQAALEGLATCAFHSNEYEAASRYCAKLVEFTPDHFERWFNLGVAEQKCGRLEEAAKAYSEAVRIRPDAKQAHVNLGIVRQEMGELKLARESYERALQIAPDLADVIYNLASVLEQQGEKEEAERLYVKLLTRNPEWEDAWFRLGYLRLQRADHRGAAEAFQACVRKRTPWPEAQLNLGLAYWNLGDHESAAKAFESVLETDPNSIDALRGLAALAVEREDLDKALDLQAKLIEAGERTPELFYNTGLLLQKSGQIEDAIRLYQEALAERPNFRRGAAEFGPCAEVAGQPGRCPQLLASGSGTEAGTRDRVFRAVIRTRTARDKLCCGSPRHGYSQLH